MLHNKAIRQLNMLATAVNSNESVNTAGKKCTALSSAGKNL